MNKEVNEFLMDIPTVKKEQDSEPSINQMTSTIESQFYTDALNENNINDIIDDQKPELIVLFGLNDLGKTTFVGSFYHLLRVNGEIDEYKFVDSDTFAGFERRIFLRKCNKEGISTTNRTSRLENQFLTLHLVHKTTKVKRNIIISDRAGEQYRDYISREEQLLKDKTIKHANRILIFVNAEQLTDRSYLTMKDDLRSLLHRLKENKMLPLSANKYIIFNKYDKADTENIDFRENKDSIVALIEDMFESSRLEQFCINSKNLENNKDLENLFKIIIRPIAVEKTVRALDWINIAIKSIKNNERD